jgi:hypothetical protein
MGLLNLLWVEIKIVPVCTATLGDFPLCKTRMFVLLISLTRRLLRFRNVTSDKKNTKFCQK